MKILIICYVPEIACRNNQSMKDISTKVEEAFLKASKSCKLDVVKILEKNRSLVIKNLKEIAQELTNPNKKAIVYYYGHGDQIKDTSGDEKDGKDEIWQTQGIIDDEISKIFANIHDSLSTCFLMCSISLFNELNISTLFLSLFCSNGLILIGFS